MVSGRSWDTSPPEFSAELEDESRPDGMVVLRKRGEIWGFCSREVYDRAIQQGESRWELWARMRGASRG